MAEKVLVCGHRNPDNDSISSAVAYAYFKNKIAEREGLADQVTYVPVRLGPVPPESAWVLERNNIPTPEVIGHVRARVCDAMTCDPVSISPDETMMEAGRLLRKHKIRSLVVKDDEQSFMGLISTRAIAERYISATDLLEDADPNSTMAVATSLIESLNQKVGELMATDVLRLGPEDLLREASSDLIASELREGVVLDDEGKVLGILTRSDITPLPKRKVVLVDHNEQRQAVAGIEDADVVEIVDHHRIADVCTSNPIKFLNLPWGSTATIVARQYKTYDIEIPKEMAEVLLSAIMTDTVVLKSPTTTAEDHRQAKILGDIIGVDPVEFGVQVFHAKSGGAELDAKRIVEADSKEFQLGDDVVLIAQHETVDLKGIMQREEELREHMRTLKDARGYDFVLLLVTDILKEGSQFLLEGNPRIVNQAFDIKCEPNGGNWMPGVLSRKKQVAAKLIEYTS